jgi:hypothetical protein
MLSHHDTQACARAAARLTLDLQDPPSDDHGIVRRDHALILLAEDGVEIDGADGHEGIRGIEGRPPKRRIVLRHVGVAEVRIRGVDGPNACCP